MTNKSFFYQDALDAGMTPEQASAVTNSFQINAFEHGIAYIDALKFSNVNQINALKTFLHKRFPINDIIKIEYLAQVEALDKLSLHFFDAMRFTKLVHIFAFQRGLPIDKAIQVTTEAQVSIYENFKKNGFDEDQAFELAKSFKLVTQARAYASGKVDKNTALDFKTDLQVKMLESGKDPLEALLFDEHYKLDIVNQGYPIASLHDINTPIKYMALTRGLPVEIAKLFRSQKQIDEMDRGVDIDQILANPATEPEYSLPESSQGDPISAAGETKEFPEV